MPNLVSLRIDLYVFWEADERDVWPLYPKTDRAMQDKVKDMLDLPPLEELCVFKYVLPRAMVWEWACNDPRWLGWRTHSDSRTSLWISWSKGKGWQPPT